MSIIFIALPGQQVLLVVGQAGEGGEEDGGGGGAGEEGQGADHHQEHRVPHWNHHAWVLGVSIC